MDIDKFGEIIDGFLKENEIGIMIRFPKGSLEPEIEDNHGLGVVINYYMVLHTLKNLLKELIETEGPLQVDRKRAPELINKLIDLIKRELMEEYDDL